jgi:acyl-coenzyme A thioesterase PaaI-like protein
VGGSNFNETHWFSEDLGHTTTISDTSSTITLSVEETISIPASKAPRVATLAILADIVAGSVIQKRVYPKVPLTVDLDVRQSHHHSMTQVHGIARAVRIGGSISVVEVRFYSDETTTAPFALSHVRFVTSPHPTHLLDPSIKGFSATGRLRAPLPEALGVEVIGHGVVRLTKHPYVLQPSGTIQGGAIALVGELAIESEFESPVVDIDVHYLAATKAGPIESRTTQIGSDLARVDIIDKGNDDRLVAIATGRVLSL